MRLGTTVVVLLASSSFAICFGLFSLCLAFIQDSAVRQVSILAASISLISAAIALMSFLFLCRQKRKQNKTSK